MKQKLSPSTAYLLIVIVAGLGVIPVAWWMRPDDLRVWPELLYLGIATQIASLLPVRWSRGMQTFDAMPLTAVGLLAPGAVVAVVAWVAVSDGRWPGREVPVARWLGNRARTAIEHAIPSLVAASLPFDGSWALPARTAVYSLLTVSVGYLITAQLFAIVERTNVIAILLRNVGLTTVRSMLVLGVGGGILYALLVYPPRPLGFLMAPGLLGFLLIVRDNVSASQKQFEARLQTLELAAQALDARDPYTESHSQRVAELAVRLGEAMKLSPLMVDSLKTAGSLHDLGKIGIRDHILHKTGKLTDEEWEIMKMHPDLGADMIARHSELAPLAPMVRHHHERWNGTGYPANLAGDAIPLGARIIAVADSYDTITGVRLYRQTYMTPIEAVADIAARSGEWYDPDVVNALRLLHGLEPMPVSTDVVGPAGPARDGWLATLRAYPPLARLIAATGISSLGDPLTTVGTLVALYSATHQPLAVAATYVVKAGATGIIGTLTGRRLERLDRRRLIVSLELIRGALLVATPILLQRSIWVILPIVFVHAAIEAVVQPARQAAVPELVPEAQVGRATSLAAAASTASSMGGILLAGAILLVTSTAWLFVLDGLTFVISALLVASAGFLGGRINTQISGAALRVLANPKVRQHILVAAMAAFFIAMSLPAVVALAYQQSSRGSQAFVVLELVLTLGMIIGNLVTPWLTKSSALSPLRIGLLIMGGFSLAVAASQQMYMTAILLFVASVGNALYTTGNIVALLGASTSEDRGRVMSARFTLGYAGAIAGSAVGGWLCTLSGPRATYGLIGGGLVLVLAATWVLRDRSSAPVLVETLDAPPMLVDEVDRVVGARL